MIKNALAAVILLAGASRAQMVAPAAMGRAWSGAVSGAVASAGLDAVSSLGGVALPRLAAPDASGTIPMLKTPALLAPLAQALVRAGHSPDEFAARPTAEKLRILAAAASEAEAELSARAGSLAEDAAGGVKRSNAAGLSKSAAHVRAMAVYLDAAAESKLAAAEKAVNRYNKAREEAARAFLEDLPAKMAAGEFEGGKYLIRDAAEGGWRAADGAPDEVFATPQEALEARVAAAEAMPAGPWSLAEAALLADAAAAAAGKGQVSAEWLAGSAERLTAVKKRGEAASAEGTLGRAARDLAESRGLNGKQIKAIEKFYENAVERGGFDPSPDSVRVRARVLAGIQTGGAGLPGWQRMLAARRDFSARMNRLAIRSGIAWGVLMAAMIAATSSMNVAQTLGGWGTAAFMVAMMSPIFVFCWAIWQRDETSRLTMSYMLETMRRRFKD